VGCRPYFKKTTKSGLDLVHGFNAFFVGLSLSPGTTLGSVSSASSVAVVGSSCPGTEAVCCSSVEISVSFVHVDSTEGFFYRQPYWRSFMLLFRSKQPWVALQVLFRHFLQLSSSIRRR
jgi:hypothetical protein